MPRTNKDSYNEYMKNYMAARYARLVEEGKKILGNKCELCSSTTDLEFHHKDPKTKIKNVTVMTRYSRKKFLEELEKCILLCKACHRTKTNSDISIDHGQGLTGKRGCYCELCKPLKQIYNRKFIRYR